MAEIGSSKLDSVILALSRVEGDLSVPLLVSLVAIARHPGISVNELASLTDTPQQSASRYVAILQGRYEMPAQPNGALSRGALISLEINADDPRKRALYLTPRGRDRVKRFLADLFER